MLLVCVGALGEWRVNLTPSIPPGVYRVMHTPTVGPPRNTVVITCLPIAVARVARDRGYLARGTCPGHTLPVGKPVVAIAGDTVQFTAAGMVRQGHLMPASAPLPQDTHGRRLIPYPFGTLVVPPAALILIAPTPRSYDSRYWGPIPLTLVRAIVTPIWTWSPDDDGMSASQIVEAHESR